jgi:polysaccharide deacetylase 2 family uncharacterized protein YibQ
VVTGRGRFLPFLAAILLLFTGTGTASGAEPVPAISIIIDDIGYRRADDRRALELPGPVALAILPHSPHAAEMSALAAGRGKEVLLHLPMEPAESSMRDFLGPGALFLDMSREDFVSTLAADLESVPHATGVNNHMGSLLTRHAGRMEWLMDALRLHGKFYVDSMTSNLSVAGEVATRYRVPHLRRDVFLDNRQNTGDIRAQFRRLIDVARRRGRALAIGHPRPETLAVLEEELPLLARYGVRLVPPRELLGMEPVPRLVPVSTGTAPRTEALE